MYDLSKAEDLKGGNQLIPAGTIVECSIKISPEKKSPDSGNTFHDAELEVSAGQYNGSRMFDNIMVSGKALAWGQGKMKHIVEFSNAAHLAGNERFYKIETPVELSGRRALVKVKIEPHTNKDGKSYLINKVDTYISPRPDSSTYKYYAAWAKGEQPWQIDDRPPLPNAHVSRGASGGDFHSEIPFG